MSIDHYQMANVYPSFVDGLQSALSVYDDMSVKAFLTTVPKERRQIYQATLVAIEEMSALLDAVRHLEDGAVSQNAEDAMTHGLSALRDMYLAVRAARETIVDAQESWASYCADQEYDMEY